MQKEIPPLKSEHSAQYTREKARALITEATGTNVTEDYLDFLLGQLPEKTDPDEEFFFNTVDSGTVGKLIKLERQIHPPSPQRQTRITPKQEEAGNEAKPTAFWKEKARILADHLRPEAEEFRGKWLGNKRPLSSLKKANEWIEKQFQEERKQSSQIKVEFIISGEHLKPKQNPRSKEFKEIMAKALLEEDSWFCGHSREYIAYPDPSGSVRRFPLMSHDGALFALHRLAEKMANSTNWGTEAHWVVFILTDMTVLSFLRGTNRASFTNDFGGLETAKIILELDPWVNFGELKRFYEERRQELSQSYPYTSFVNRPSDRVLALLRFVENNKTMSWEERFKLWKTTYPKWKGSYSDMNSFKTSYHKSKAVYRDII